MSAAKVGLDRERAAQRRNYSRLYCFLRIFQFFLFPIRRVGWEKLPVGAFILCSNHTDNLDVVLLAMALTRKYHPRFMMKMELSRVPILGRVFKSVGSFYVDRDVSDIGAIRTALSYLRRGEMLMIFPQGRRVSAGDAVAAKAGAVRLASKTGVPIVPAFVVRKKRLFRANQVVFGEPYYIEKTEADIDARSDELLKKIFELESPLCLS